MESSSLEPLVEVGQHNIALLFCNYLVSQSITAEVKATNGRFVVLVNGYYLGQARILFEEFIQQPDHPKYQQAAWDNAQVTEIHGGVPANTFTQQFLKHAGVVTLLVFSTCWLVFILSLLGWHASIFEWLRFYTTNNDIDVLFTEPWRLVGPALFHFSWLHIVFNTMWWWQIGGSIEKIFGKGELIQLFFLSAILSNLGQFLVSGPNFGGLSGVVYALVGYAWWAGWLAPDKGLSLSKPIVGFLLIWLLLGYTDFMPVNMANTAHLLGLISGCFLAWWRFKIKRVS
ncbi:rhomboid family intramembrane serine protease GlpG [Thalassotalea profundi]|uniref:Rhomboid family intramembrane serine protease GlpG n=1 Tax=Thalassotalea profundi TaxID=2036687 RepID=A0ABQ3IWW3_9GAMM|nr:rhomboid family intramembrane serine protease GlpG [Thalassotalea profundi]GHE97027.1 rhomboid family intramembrane serine protease GlpG [Thalassotalea profundi]